MYMKKCLKTVAASGLGSGKSIMDPMDMEESLHKDTFNPLALMAVGYKGVPPVGKSGDMEAHVTEGCPYPHEGHLTKEARHLPHAPKSPDAEKAAPINVRGGTNWEPVLGISTSTIDPTNTTGMNFSTGFNDECPGFCPLDTIEFHSSESWNSVK